MMIIDVHQNCDGDTHVRYEWESERRIQVQFFWMDKVRREHYARVWVIQSTYSIICTKLYYQTDYGMYLEQQYLVDPLVTRTWDSL